MRLVQVDAFTSEPFSGNPAAVCLLDAPADVSWMQDVAAELNLSETAFVSRRHDGRFDLRWFTPRVEVDLCGHATLASAHVLWEEGDLEPDSAARFHTRSGPLVCSRRGEEIEMDFPARPVWEVDPPSGLIEALGVRPAGVFRSDVSYLLELSSESEVRETAPDFGALGRVEDGWTCITAPATTDGFDFVSRFFAPQAGIDEDPVTGSSHCALAAFWSPRLGRFELYGYQCSSRGGAVSVRIDGDRVRLGGRAVTVMRGELLP